MPSEACPSTDGRPHKEIGGLQREDDFARERVGKPSRGQDDLAARIDLKISAVR